MSMKIDHGMSFFSKRDAFLRATDLGIKLEYIDEEPSEESTEEKKVKTEDRKIINLKPEPFKELGPDGLTDASEESKDSTNPFDKVKREYTVNGFKVSKTPLANDDEIAVLVSDPQWSTEGFLKAKYVTYQMKTPSLGYDVRRKDKDYILFQEYLNKVYPHILVPVIPEVQKDRKSSNKYWERRGKELQTFMNKLLQSEDLKTWPILVDFIKHQDTKGFSKLLKGWFDKHIKPTGTKDLFSTTGFHTIDANPSILEFTDRMPSYMSFYETNMKKFHQLSRHLTEQYHEISKTWLEMSEWANKLSKMYKFSHNYQYSSLYDDITSTMKRWSAAQEQTAKIVAGLAVYHTFNEQHMASLKTLDSNKIFHQTAYEKALINLDKK